MKCISLEKEELELIILVSLETLVTIPKAVRSKSNNNS
jgi:hypothetical protein